MSKPALARLAVSTASRGVNGAGQSEGRNLANALDEHREQQHRREAQREPTKPVSYAKTLHLHIGGDLQIPVRSARFEHPAQRAETRAQQQEAAAARDPFDGLPLRAWAERLGERVMPAYELIKEEQAAAKRADKALDAKVPELRVPAVPHLLPFTRWAAQSKRMQATFVVDESKPRKKARLSWYHPDDTMVPRDWFRGGLLKDLAYYRPFASES